MPIDFTKVRKLVALDKEKKELEARIKEIAKERTPVETAVLEEMASEDCDKLRCQGFEISTHTVHFAAINKEMTKAEICEVLKKAGREDLVKKAEEETFNTNSLNAAIREYIEEDVPLPKEFEGTIKPDRKTLVRTKQAA